MKQERNKAAIVSMIGCIGIAAVYIAVLLKLVVFKNGFTTSARGLNLIPCEFMIGLIQGDMTVSVFLKNVVGNIAVFVPMGILLSVLFPKMSARKAVTIGFFISLFIELSQLIIGLGIGDIDDLITNTIGVLIGVILYWKLTRSWDIHWENSFASFLMLCFIGISSAAILYFFGYGNRLTRTPSEIVNVEILNGLDEKHATSEFRCENIVDQQLIGYQVMDNEENMTEGISVAYSVDDHTRFYTKTIKSNYSINGNVNHITVTYNEVNKSTYQNLIGEEGKWVNIWLDDSKQCYAVMTTLYE